jgi:glyoxylase-like metal-dependent hydrolase (beta-lactamase superfamily II)
MTAITSSLSIENRTMPIPLADDLWIWSVFSGEKQVNFNGYVLKTEDGLVIIDPPSSEALVIRKIQSLGHPVAILLTNRDHERASAAVKNQLNIPVMCHEMDAPLLEIAPDNTFQEGEFLFNSLEVIHLSNQKSPGECVLYQAAERRLFLGDALIHKAGGQLSMLPNDKYSNVKLARQGLTRLQTFADEIDRVLVGDGEPILVEGGSVLRDYFHQHK